MAYVPSPNEKPRDMVIKGFIALHAVKARLTGEALRYTVKELAEFSGVSVSTIYNHFRDIDYLSCEALRKRTAMLAILLDQSLDDPSMDRDGIKWLIYEYGRDICLYYQPAILSGVQVGLSEGMYQKLNSRFKIPRSSLLGAMYAAAGGASREVFSYLYDIQYPMAVGSQQ